MVQYSLVCAYFLPLFFLAFVSCAKVATPPSTGPEVADMANNMADSSYDTEFTATGRTIVVSTSGNDTAFGDAAHPYRTITKAASVANPGDLVLIRAGIYSEFVRLTRGGTPGNPVIFKADGIVVLEDPNSPDWAYDWDGVFNVYQTAYVVVSGLRIQGSHWFGIGLYQADNVTIQNCITYRTGASGIYAIQSSGVTVRGNTVRRACTRTTADTTVATQECISLDSVSGFDVYRNEVFDTVDIDPAVTLGGEGIDIKNASATGTVSRNVVHDLARLGIYVDAWNAVSLHDVIVERNLVYGCDHGIAVSSEAGGTAEIIDIVNNIVHDNRNNGIVISAWVQNGPRRNVTIMNNTAVRNGTSSWGGGIAVENADASGVIIRNNICSDNVKWQLAVYPQTGMTVDYNLINGFRSYDYAREITGTDALVDVDPVFVDTLFRIGAASPARDSGSRQRGACQ